MLLSQRILLIAGLLVIAWLLHVNLCDWMVNGQPMRRQGAQQQEILAWVATETTHGTGDPTTTYTTYTFTGLFTELGVGYTASFALGVIVPLALVLLVGCLLLGARPAIRRQRGLCAKCGYDLRGLNGTSTKCPECGAELPPSIQSG